MDSSQRRLAVCLHRVADVDGFCQTAFFTGLLEKDKVFNYPPIANVMSRARFLEINCYLHVTSNAALHGPGSPGYDKLGKIKPIITA